MNLKATLKLIVLIVCSGSLVLLFSCKTKQAVTTQYVKVDSIVYKESVVTKYDTVITPADSAYIKAYFECDSLGNVLISNLNEEKGNLKIKTIFRNNTIEVRVNVDSAAIIRKAIESYVKESNVNNSQVATVEKKTKSFNWFVYYLLGIITMILLGIVGYTIRKKLKI